MQTKPGVFFLKNNYIILADHVSTSLTFEGQLATCNENAIM